MRVLVDTNIILDFLLEREPFFQDAERLFQAIDAGQIVGYVTATTLTDIFYISRRHTGNVELARRAVSDILLVMMVCPVNRAILETALMLNVVDFEDAVQVASALAQNLEAIVTRDADFVSPALPVLSTQDVLQ